mgnify:CR=1 FL=1
MAEYLSQTNIQVGQKVSVEAIFHGISLSHQSKNKVKLKFFCIPKVAIQKIIAQGVELIKIEFDIFFHFPCVQNWRLVNFRLFDERQSKSKYMTRKILFKEILELLPKSK